MVATRLGVSPSLIHVWIKLGVLAREQRTWQSYCWVTLTEADLARLDGLHDWSQFPTVREVMRDRGGDREAIWDRVRSGEYRAYRHLRGQRWEWRLQRLATAPGVPARLASTTNAYEANV
jgi:hypothetical protein